MLLRVGIQARDSSERSRPAAALTFVIDTSGSMAREDRLELVKDSLRQLVRGLGRGDSIAVVTFGDDARVVLPPTRATDDDRILAAIDELQPSGSTNLEAGLRLGYQLARETLLGDGIDRVILASDGVANVGLTDADGILGRIRDDAAAGIELVSIGVGMGNYNDTLLEQLADQGDGFYAYVNDLVEARQLFIEDLISTLQTVALDAKVQVEFDPERRRDLPAHRLREPGHRRPATSAIRRVDAGAIGAGHAVTALYDLELRDGVSRDDVPRDRPAALDRARGRRTRSSLRTRHRGRRPGRRASRRPTRPSGSTRSWRPRPRRFARTAARTGRPARRSSTSPTRTTGCRPPTRPRLGLPRAARTARPSSAD